MTTQDPRVELQELIRQVTLLSADLGSRAAILFDQIVLPLEENLRLMSDADPFRALFIAFNARQALFDVRIIGPQMEIALVRERAREKEAENAAEELVVKKAMLDLQTLKWTMGGKLLGAAIGSGGIVGILVAAALSLLKAP